MLNQIANLSWRRLLWLLTAPPLMSRLINKEKHSSKDRANNSRRKDYEKGPHKGKGALLVVQ
jgi:hypothetical protein